MAAFVSTDVSGKYKLSKGWTLFGFGRFINVGASYEF